MLPIYRELEAVLQVFGSMITLSLSDIIAIFGILVALDQYRKNRTAQEAVRQLKRSLLKQRSSQYFDELSRKAATLSSTLRSRNWSQVSEIATQLGGLISSASGFSQKLILDDERDELRLAAASLKIIWEGIPVDPDHQEVSNDAIQVLMSHCMVIVYAVDKVGGRMKYLGELEEEDQMSGRSGWFKKTEPKVEKSEGAISPAGGPE